MYFVLRLVLQIYFNSSRKKIDLEAEIRILKKNIQRLKDHLKKIAKELYASELNYNEAKMKLEELEQVINKGKMRFKVVLCHSIITIF